MQIAGNKNQTEFNAKIGVGKQGSVVRNEGLGDQLSEVKYCLPGIKRMNQVIANT